MQYTLLKAGDCSLSIYLSCDRIGRLIELFDQLAERRKARCPEEPFFLLDDEEEKVREALFVLLDSPPVVGVRVLVNCYEPWYFVATDAESFAWDE